MNLTMLSLPQRAAVRVGKGGEKVFEWNEPLTQCTREKEDER